jgi:hypothetical protein
MSDDEVVRVECDGRVLAGRVLDLRGAAVDPERVGRAVRTGPVDGLCVECPEPRRVSEYVGVVSAVVTVPDRTALAAAGRSRGLSTPQDEEIATVRQRLGEEAGTGTDAGDRAAGRPHNRSGGESGEVLADPAAARRRLAGTESTVERLRERVATLRGRVQAAREAGRNTAQVETELAEAARELSEAETERAAAREALDRAERRARRHRDDRERRRRRQDRLANLERDARSHLVGRLREEYAAAVDDLVGVEDPFAVDDVTAALAVGRVADLRAPVVLAVDRFDSPARAADWLSAPLVRV